MTTIAVPTNAVRAAYAQELVRLAALNGFTPKDVAVTQGGFDVPATVAAGFSGAVAIASYDAAVTAASLPAGAATDAEVAAAIAVVEAGNATQAELDAAVATINTALAAKQASATAATDAELAAHAATPHGSSGAGTSLRTGFYYPMGSIPGTLTDTVPAIDRLYLRPILIRDTQAFDRLGFHCTFAGAGSSVDLTLYNAAAGVPTTIRQTVNVDTTTNGAKAGVIAQTLPPGLYFVAYRAKVAAPTVVGFAGSTMNELTSNAQNPPNDIQMLQGQYVITYAGAMADNPVVGTSSWLSDRPLVSLRAAA